MQYDVITYETFDNEKDKPYAYANKLMSRQNVYAHVQKGQTRCYQCGEA